MAFFPLAPLVAGAAVLAVAATAFAQAPGSPPKLAPVVVESSVLPSERTRTEEQAREDIDRTPGGVELVPQKTIEDSRAANLKDVLDFVPGVLIRPRFGAADESQLSIRGSGLRNNFHLRGINVLIDGFPYGNADGFSDFESLELLNTRYIEVFKGANALRFGGNTMGGAINLVSKTGSTAGLIESRVEGGSYGFFKGYLATGQVYGPLDLYASFSDTELQGYREHSQQTRYRAFGTAGYVAARRHHAALRPRLHAQRGAAPGRAHTRAVRPEPAAAESGHEVRQGGAQLRLHARRPHAAHAARRQPGLRVVDPAQLPGPRPPAVLRRHRRHHVRLQHRAALYPGRAALRPRQSLHRGLPVLRHAAERRPVPERQRRPRQHDQEPGERRQHVRDVRRGPVRRRAHRVARGRAGGSR